MKTFLWLPVLVALTAWTAVSQGRRDAGALAVLRSADADKDGTISAAEWTQQRRKLTSGDSLDTRAIQLAILAPLIDRDGDGKWTKADLNAIFISLDADKNGALEIGEFGRPNMTRSGVANLVARFADTDVDGKVSSAEWTVFVASCKPDGAGVLDAEHFEKMILESEPATDKREAAARAGAFTWQVTLMTFESQLDDNSDGKRDGADLDAMFARFDRNGDKAITADELTTRGAARRNTTRRTGPIGPARGGLNRRGGGAARGNRDLPPRMQWQRNLDDALALVERTGKPLLICVNVDDETACENLAWNRYRDPEFGALASGFIQLLASPNRHGSSDYDDRGRRIVDPKFGRVTNAEHIEIEPLLFEKYFKGRRVAPRHIGIDKNGKELFDIFLTGGLEPIDAALRTHGIRTAVKDEILDLRTATDTELFDNPDAGHRDRLESWFVEADTKTRMRLASAALSDRRATQHPDLLWLGLRDPDVFVRTASARCLAAHPTQASIEFFPAAFAAAIDDAATRRNLIAALHRLTTSDEPTKTRALRLRNTLSSLAVQSSWIDVTRWMRSIEGHTNPPIDPPSPDELDALDERLASLQKAIKANPKQAALHIDAAEATLRYARIRLLQGQNPSLLFDDASTAAERALALAPNDVRARGLMALARHGLGDMEAAGRIATTALPDLRRVAKTRLAADALHVFIDARLKAIYEAMTAARAWPSDWVADVGAAYAVLLVHPLLEEKHCLDAAAFYGALEAYAEQGAMIRRGLGRFPASSKLHEQLRMHALRHAGAQALEDVYDQLDVPPGYEATMDWYAGLAILVGAERRVQQNQKDAAIGAYERSRQRFETSVEGNPTFASSANHYVALARSGSARIHVEGGRLDRAITDMLAALAIGKASVEAEDGLGNSPAANARQLHRALVAADRADAADQLKDAMDAAGIE